MVGFYDIEMENCVQISVFQSYKSQVCVNRYFYLAASDAFVPATVLTDFWTVFYPLLREIQAAALTYDHLNLTYLWDGRHSVDKALSSNVGLAAGEGMPAFIGSRFKLFPQYSRIRKGRKIITGVTETMMEGDDLASAFITPMTNVALNMGYPLTLDSITFTPVLISPANTKHAELSISPIVDVNYVGWSTQSSRKIGRGV